MNNKISTSIVRIAIAIPIVILFSANRNASTNTGHRESELQIAQALSQSEVYTSDYSAIDRNSCEIVQLDEETGASTSVCPSYNNIPVFIYHSDGRYSLSIGEELNNSNDIVGLDLGKLGNKLEWRSQNDEPIAVIYRHHILYFNNAPQPIESVLVIRKMSGNIASCTVGVVNGSMSNANKTARLVADKEAVNFRCGTDSIKKISN